jgi:hypothetical protein
MQIEPDGFPDGQFLVKGVKQNPDQPVKEGWFLGLLNHGVKLFRKSRHVNYFDLAFNLTYGKRGDMFRFGRFKMWYGYSTSFPEF